MVMGLPGSGKSYFAKNLALKLAAAYISSDDFRKKMGLMGKYQIQDKLSVYHELIRSSKDLLMEGNTVVLDATFYLKSVRDLVESLAKSIPCKIIKILVKAEEEIIELRLSKPRIDSEADHSVYLQIREQFEPLDEEYLELQSTNSNLEENLKKAIHYINNKNDQG